ncbi:radical SAM protein, partial [Candidatus Poribacteria bacterium]|nr:radical SAM protein [Candidatus Poribacteria bacterium]
MNFLAGKKLVNLVLVNVSRRLGLRRSLGRPFFMLIDPCNFCNLRCPLCISVLEKGNFGEGFMPIALYREALEYFGPYLTHLNLYNWGEPFLNKHIYEMIRLAKGYDIHVTISSNLNAGEPAEIVDSGLDVLVCSLDGATQATYEKYRVKGNLERALARARQIVRLRKEKGVSKPLLIWQYLLFEHNKDELEMARGLAEQGGFDNFVSGPGHVWVEHPVIKPVSGELSRNEKGSLQ